MSVIQNNLLLADDGYNLQRSLRFRSSASAFLNRTPASAGNRRTWTWSGWVKRGVLGTNQFIFSTYGSGTDTTSFYLLFNSSNQLILSTQAVDYRISNSVYRDPSAWYHIVAVLDANNGTAQNRMRLWVNGSEITSWATNTSVPSQDFGINLAQQHRISSRAVINDLFFDGYLTEVNFIDGQALTPSSFGANNAQTGVWQPKKYAGTYGTNGYYLPFSDNASTTTLGNDFSGNGNNWTTNNISLTAGSTYDSMTDVPTLTSATAANYCVLNPLDKLPAATTSAANLQFSAGTAGVWNSIAGTIAVSSGKWYWEYTVDTTGVLDRMIGIYSLSDNLSFQTFPGNSATSYGYYGPDGRKFNNGSGASYGATYQTAGDVIGVALDMDAGTLTFYKNNTSQGTAFTGLTGTFKPAFGATAIAVNNIVNFGQRPFAYTPPTGFVALNTFNLPTPTIGATASTQANKYFDATVWAGNNASPRTITNSGSFQPDFVWLKDRTIAHPHYLYDAVRGAGNNRELATNSTGVEGSIGASEYGYLSAFTSSGFTLTAGTDPSFGTADTNYTGSSFVGWQWNAGGNTVTNTSGSISSQVRANTSAGFSVVTYTTTGANATVGHGLGVAPKMVIVKGIGAVTSWLVWHQNILNTEYLVLNSTGAKALATTVWNSTSPSSSVFSIGTTFPATTYVAYCFSEVAGYSKIGSYTGNGSADGQFIYTGFRPRFVMVKQTGFANDWGIFDSSRNPSNAAQNILYPNLSNAEGVFSAGTPIDFLSNGFKLYGNSLANSSAGGGGYIYMAFAENPFKYSLAR